MSGHGALPMPRLRLAALLAAIAIAATLPLGCAGPDARSERPIVHLASDVWAPFTDHVGRPRVAVELVEGALGRAGVRVQSTTERDFGRVIERLQSGDLDGCAAVWRTPERESFLVFSRPYLENRLVLVGREGTDVSAAGFAELAGKRIGIVGSYAYGDAVEAATTGAGGPVFVPGPSDTENIRALLRGAVDVVLVDDLVIRNLFAHHGARAEAVLEVGRVPLVRRELHFAVRRGRPDAAAIIARFDEEIAAMLADGSYHRALGVDWIRADVDGDGKVELVLGGDRAGADAPSEGYDLFADGGGPAGTTERYLIEGQTYDGWDAVPLRFKSPVDASTERSRPEFIIADF